MIRRWPFILFAFLAACKAGPGYIAVGQLPPLASEQQPYGFAEVHLGIVAFGALMLVAGIVLAFVASQVKMGSSLAVAGLATLALGWAAGYFGKEIALASAVVLGIGAVGVFAALGWYAWKYHGEKQVKDEIVGKMNGQLESADLTPATRASVERSKARATKETK